MAAVISGATEDEFSYGPLPLGKNCIRILVLYPADEAERPIECDLEVIALDEGAEYTALSYSWAMQDGTTSLCREILIHGKRKRVAQNLFEALRRLRPRDRSIRMWIDALSIDQSNSDERSAQVRMMASIFSNAAKVVAWLGEGEFAMEDEAAWAIMSCLIEGKEKQRRHHDIASHYWFTRDARKHRCAWSNVPGLPEMELVETTIRRGYDALCALFARRYWTRRWIVQELYHARDVDVIWGQRGYGCKLGTMRSLAIIVQRTLVHTGPAKQLFRAAKSLLGLLDVLSSQLGLVRALRECRHMQCSDARDRLYSLASLEWRLCPSLHYGFAPETVYTFFGKVLWEDGLWEDVSWYLMNHKRMLANNMDDRKLPSWAPDLRYGPQIPRIREVGGASTVTEDGEGEELPFWRRSRPQAHVDAQGILTYSPFILGTVAEITPSADYGKKQLSLWSLPIPDVKCEFYDLEAQTPCIIPGDLLCVLTSHLSEGSLENMIVHVLRQDEAHPQSEGDVPLILVRALPYITEPTLRPRRVAYQQDTWSLRTGNLLLSSHQKEWESRALPQITVRVR